MQTQEAKRCVSRRLISAPILNSYFPDGPYRVKTGEKAGKHIETLMFENPKYLFSLKNYLDEKLNGSSCHNEFHMHLAWVLAKSELRRPVAKCSFCGKETAKKTIFVRGNSGRYFSHKGLLCCDDPACIEQLKDAGLLNYTLRKREEVQLKFSAIAELPLDLAEIQKFLCMVFGISELTPETAFEFFNR